MIDLLNVIKLLFKINNSMIILGFIIFAMFLFLIISVHCERKRAFEKLVKEAQEELEKTSSNKSIDLVKLLKGHEGERIYCILTGEYVTIDCILNRTYRPIIVKDKDGIKWPYPKEGYKFDDYPEGECMLVPSKTERNWKNFNKTKS